MNHPQLATPTKLSTHCTESSPFRETHLPFASQPPSTGDHCLLGPSPIGPLAEHTSGCHYPCVECLSPLSQTCQNPVVDRGPARRSASPTCCQKPAFSPAVGGGLGFARSPHSHWVGSQLGWEVPTGERKGRVCPQRWEEAVGVPPH